MANVIGREDFEGAGNNANATNLTTAFTTSVSGTGSVVHSTDRFINGTRCLKVNAAVNSRIIKGNWASSANCYVQFYFYLPVAPPANAFFMNIRNGADSAVATQFGFNAAGAVRVRDDITEIGTAAITPGQWYRADWTMLGAGDQTLRLYTGANLHNTVIATASFVITGALTATNFSAVQVGNIATVTGGWTFYADYLEVNNTNLPSPLIVVNPEPDGDPLYRRVAGSAVLQKIKRRVAGTATTFIFNRKAGTTAGPAFSDLLVPREGCLFGASVPPVGQSGGSNLSGLNSFESISHQDIHTVKIYRNGAWNDGVSVTERGMLERAGHDRAIGFYTWKIGNSTPAFTWTQIANGSCDARITAAANALKTYPYKFFLSFFHEPDDDIDPSGQGTAADYVAHYQHAVTLFRAAGCDNAVFTMNYMGYGTWAGVIPSLYPGDAYVDWIGWDPYAHANDVVIADIINSEEGAGSFPTWHGFYNWAAATHPSKPLFLGEWGLDFNDHNGAYWATFISDMAETLESDYPKIKHIAYWNQDLNMSDYILNGAGKEATQAEFAVLAAKPYFHHVNVNDAP